MAGRKDFQAGEKPHYIVLLQRSIPALLPRLLEYMGQTLVEKKPKEAFALGGALGYIGITKPAIQASRIAGLVNFYEGKYFLEIFQLATWAKSREIGIKKEGKKSISIFLEFGYCMVKFKQKRFCPVRADLVES